MSEKIGLPPPWLLLNEARALRSAYSDYMRVAIDHARAHPHSSHVGDELHTIEAYAELADGALSNACTAMLLVVEAMGRVVQLTAGEKRQLEKLDAESAPRQ